MAKIKMQVLQTENISIHYGKRFLSKIERDLQWMSNKLNDPIRNELNTLTGRSQKNS